MAFVSSGKDIAVRRNEQNGKYTFDWCTEGGNKGNPRFDDTRSHSVLLVLYSHKRDTEKGTGGYYWDRSGRRGTFLYQAKQDRLATLGLLQAYAEDAGQQLMKEGLIIRLEATAKRLHRGRWTLSVQWSVPSGPHTHTLSLSHGFTHLF